MNTTARGRLEILADAGSLGVEPEPFGLIADTDGRVIFCDVANHRIWRLDQDGTGEPLAGSGESGNDGDGGAATSARIDRPYEVRRGSDGDLWFVDMSQHVVRRVSSDGAISTLAGTGEPGYSGDGGDARLARLQQPHSIAFDPRGDLFIADIANHRVRRVANGTIETVMGTGEQAPTRIGEPAGGCVIADTESHTIRYIDPEGVITTLAGDGEASDSLDAGAACLNRPHGVEVTPEGDVLIGDSDNHRVLRLVGAGLS